MRWSELTPIQQLAVKQALFKVLADDVSTKNPSNLRGEVDGEITDWYRATGAKSFDINFDGYKVGTVSVNVSKEVPEKSTTVYDLVDSSKFYDWMETESGMMAMMDYCFSEAGEFVQYVLATSGELPDGIEPREVIEPARPSSIKGTTLRIDPERVSRAFGNELPSTMAGLLGGGELG